MGPSEIGKNVNTGEKKWSQWVFVATFTLLLLIGVGLRFHGLTIQSYWMDELHSARFAMPAQSLGDVMWLTAHYDAHPPLYHVLLWAWYHVFGYSELAGRLMSAFFGILGLFAIFLLGKTLWNRKAGLFALAVTSPLFFHVFYSQEVRSYSLLFLLTILSWWAIVSLIRKPGLFRTILYAVVSSALIYTHYFGFFVLISQAVFMLLLLVWYKKSILKPFIYCVIAGGIVVVSYLPWMPYFFGNDMLARTWIQPVSIGFVRIFIARYFLTGGEVLWVIVPLMILFAWRLPDLEEGNTQEVSKFSPFLLLVTWIIVTYGLPFILSIVKVPMLIPRVTIITLPAIVLLISSPAARLKMKFLIPISVLTCVLMAVILVSRDNYYTTQLKKNWRGVIQYVMNHDPSGEFPVVSTRPEYFRAYLWMLKDYRLVKEQQYFNPRKELVDVPITGGFWFLDAHGKNGPSSRLHGLIEKYFDPTKSVQFKGSRVVFFQFKSLSAKAELIDGHSIPLDGEIPMSQFSENVEKLPDGGIRLCSNGSVESSPFIFPEGNYRVRVLVRGNRVKGETAQFELSIGQKVVITGFTKEQPTWHEGELKIENADVLPVSISFLNDYFERIEPDTPLNPGPVIKLKEGDWNSTLTRIGETENYAAKWINKIDGTQLSDTIKIRKFTSANIVLYRKGLNGYYRGKLAPDGKSATGTADWYKGNGKWKAVSPGMKFSDTLDRNLDVLRIVAAKTP